MKEIPLSTTGKKNKGKYVTMVSDEDYELLMNYKWNVHITPWTNYATGKVNGVHIKMHRFLLNAPLELYVDHRDGNGLNNQRENIRLCTPAQSGVNRFAYGKGSKYVGVCHVFRTHWHGKKAKNPYERWYAQLQKDGKCVFRKYYLTEIEAAMAYDEAAKIYHGEFAHLNFPNKNDLLY